MSPAALPQGDWDFRHIARSPRGKTDEFLSGRQMTIIQARKLRIERGRAQVPSRSSAGPVPGMHGISQIDLKGLERELRRAVEGEVRFDDGTRGLYATDSSNFRQPPIGVVIPKTVDDVIQTHRVCRQYDAPILARGGGTSQSGETVNYAVVMDFSKYLNRILEVDPKNRVARCEPGAINDKVNEEAGRLGLRFGPDPSTHACCTIGGNLGNNSCGVHSIQARFDGDGSRASDNTAWIDVLTYDGVRMRVGPTSDGELEEIIRRGDRKGQIYSRLRDLRDRYADQIRSRYPQIPRRVSGYNLDELLPEKGFNVARALVGTEGTCVTFLEAGLKLIPKPKARTLLVLGYEDIVDVGRHVTEILENRPIGCELIEQALLEDKDQRRLQSGDLKLLPEGAAWVLVELGGESKQDSGDRARALVARLKKAPDRPVGFALFDDAREEARLWAIREGGVGATSFPPGGKDHWPGWEDSAVAPERIGDYIADLKRLYAKYGYHGAFYGHLGDGCVHSRISFDLGTPAGVKHYRSFMEEAADLVVSYGGSLSGEHGDGQQRAELLPKMFGEELVEAFREFKAIWDPNWRMNPGKVVDAYRLDEDLKLGADYNPARHKTQFAYADDHFDFAHATLRCVGIGKCRIPTGADVMCPSFMVTKEERFTTRGRARLLYEMLQGDVVRGSWRSPEVKEALDLCLACKGCTSDCPVHVDMPTYKAEFLHHHWKGRLRPRHAYAFGLIDQALRVASRVPELANLAFNAPGLSRLVKLGADMAVEREIPSLASLTLRDWFFQRGERNLGGPRVIVWPDTLNNYFHTDVGVAAVEAIEAAGWQVIMPRRHLCCGRPLYDYGFLNLARRYLRSILEELREEIRAGTPLVGIEPSCVATFKHEMTRLFPHDDDASRLSRQSHHFAEFFEAYGVEVPRLEREALLWGHCHHKATGGMESEKNLLKRMGVDVQEVKAGCCGLAGSWGFEAGHYEISISCGELGLLPRVREADPRTLILANGFSCKTQIEQGHTGRRALHLAQAMKMAREWGKEGAPDPHPEALYYLRRPVPSTGRRARRLASAAALGLVGVGVVAVAGAAGARAAGLRR